MSHHRSLNRRGVTMVESMIVLTTLLLLVFATFDLGLATMQYNMLSYAARNLARQATIHGALAPPEATAWGPIAYSGNAGDGSEIARTTIQILPTMAASDVKIQVTWPDGNNEENSRVVVQLEYAHIPFAPFLALAGPINLQAACTMNIIH